MLTLTPFLIKYLYTKKYKENTPLLSGLKKYTQESINSFK
jgi:hypothetical protein